MCVGKELYLETRGLRCIITEIGCSKMKKKQRKGNNVKLKKKELIIESDRKIEEKTVTQ